MTDKEGVKVALLTQACTVILAMDAAAENERVRLTPNERAHFDRARLEGMGMLTGPAQSAEAKLDKSEGWVAIAEQNRFADDGMFRQDGTPNPDVLDENGKRKTTDREFPVEDIPGQGLLVEPTPAHDWRIPGSGSVPADLHRGICQVIRDNPGCGKNKAVSLVCKAAGADEGEVKEHFEQLVRDGVVRKNGKGYIADLPEDGQPDGPEGSTTGDLAEARADGTLV